MVRKYLCVIALAVCHLTFSCSRGQQNNPFAKLADVAIDNTGEGPIFWVEGEKIFAGMCPKDVAPTRKNCAMGANSASLSGTRKAVESAFIVLIKKTDEAIAKETALLKQNDTVFVSMNKRLDFLASHQQLLKTELDRINEILKGQRADVVKLEKLIADEAMQLDEVNKALEKDPQNMDLKNLQQTLKTTLEERKAQKTGLSNEIVVNQDDAYQLKEQLDDVNKQIADTKKERDQYVASAKVSSPELIRLTDLKQTDETAVKSIPKVFDLITASPIVYRSKKLSDNENRVLLQVANLVGRPLREGLYKGKTNYSYELKMEYTGKDGSIAYKAVYYYTDGTLNGYTVNFTKTDGRFIGTDNFEMKILSEDSYELHYNGRLEMTFVLSK